MVWESSIDARTLVTVDDVAKMSVPDHASPDGPGKGTVFPIGDWTARIRLTPTGSVTVDYVDPAGKPCRRIKRDAAFQRAHKAELDALKARVADIEGALREARTWL